MLLTVTSNPTIDRTLHVSHLSVGEVHRASAVHMAAGGKGLNVTRAALRLNCPVLATGPLAGHAGRLMADLAVAEGIPAEWYWLPSGETRTCLLINHDAHDTTVINEPGEPMTTGEWVSFADHVKTLATQAQAVAFSGSLPPGVESSALRELAHSIATPERAVYLDSSGAALEAVLAQPTGLVIKINRAELAAGLGVAAENFSLERVIAAGQDLLERGATLVVITAGGEGALAITAEGCWQAQAPQVNVVSTVGSGDSMLAGLAIARLWGKSIAEALAYGVVCGTANALTSLPGRFERERVEDLMRLIKTKRVI